MQIANYRWMRGLNNLSRVDNNLNRVGFLAILLLSIAGVQKIFFPGPTISVVIFFCIEIILALLFLKNSKLFFRIEFKYKNVLKLFFIYGVFVVIHSIFVAKNYDQWRYLVTVFTPTLLLPFFCLLAIDPSCGSVILKNLIRITIPISFIFILEGSTDDKNHNLVYINYVSFIYFFVILIPFLRNKCKAIVILISLLSFTYDLDNRSNMISILSSYCLVAYYFLTKRAINKSFSKLFLSLLRYIFLLLPILLIISGSLGIFNVFDYIDKKGAQKEIIISSNTGRALTTDSRTGIYEDALKNLNDKNDWIFGSSATVIYTTHLANSNADYDAGRLGGSESGFLGLLTFGGLLYVSLFFALCHLSSYLAIYRSNNTVIRFVGVFIAFRWLYSFIENTLAFNFTWVTLFVALGMAFSPQFRLMTDKQISYYLKKI